jgi:membrane fusion protein (multidrug efflux system)
MKYRRHFASTALLAAMGLATTTTALAQPPGHQPPPPEVDFVTVTPQTLPVEFKYIGIAAASKTVEVRSRVRGFIKSRDFEEGALVKPGQSLFTIDQESFRADLEIAKARVQQSESRVRLAEQDVRRLQSVKEPGAIAQSDLDKQLAEQTNAAAALRLSEAELAKAELEFSYTAVESPLTGYIDKALKEIGSYVDDGQNSLLAIVRQVDPIYVSFQVSEREYLSLRGQQQRGEIQLASGDKPYVEVTLLDGTSLAERGAIDFESAVVDIDTGTVEMRAVFANADNRLKPGQFLDVRLGGWVRQNTLAVPQRAVGQSPQGAYVYVVGDDNKAEYRIVHPGEWSGKLWIISSGLHAGERVIVEGLVKVQPGIDVVPREWTGAESAEPATPAAPPAADAQ